MRKHCIILSVITSPTSHSMALLFPHLHLTVPVLATGAKGVSTRRSACVKALAFLHLGCPPQYRLCLLDCLTPTQVLSEWHSLEVITPCNIFRLGVTRINYHLALPNSAGEMEDFLSTQWESTSVRHAFIRKVRVCDCVLTCSLCQ